MFLLVAAAFAAPEVPPPNRLGKWEAPLQVESPGTRVGMIVEGTDSRPVRVDVWDGTRWLRARETYRRGGTAVLVADLDAATTTIRLRSDDSARIASLDWDLLVPVEEPRSTTPAPPSAGVLPTELVNIGVVSRASWGARATTCTTVEDDWYRMAIHHTAGTQTYGGTVEGTVRALQAYAMDSGSYCDIPYQFLVGYDGSLWEGRPYDYYSGATGGGNNDGNIAVCFLGCYDSGGCSTTHAVTSAMMEEGQVLVQNLVDMHGIASDTDSIRGHRDWPDNATACPGDLLYARLDELRAPLEPDYAGTFGSQSFPLAHEAAVELYVGEELTGYIELTNTGSETWAPGSTNLGTIPRDVASGVADESWLSPTRPASVTAATAPGASGRFTFTLQGNAVGEYDQYFGLVQEWVTWFADDGGPSDDVLRVRVIVRERPDDTAAVDSGDSGRVDSGRPDDRGVDSLAPPGSRVGFGELGGCGCGHGGGGGWLGIAALGWLVGRARGTRG